MTGGDYVAVIGMACRVPGTDGLDGFWRALAEGRELLDTVDGVAAGVVRDTDLFDPAFFGYAPSEALLIDPQQRVFLECAWEALEHAGQVPGDDVVIGVFGGSGDSDHLDRLRANHHRFPDASELQFRLASGADFLTSRVAYKLGLTGPAVTVQAACATSLVAIHLATQSVLAGECDVALAGGVTLHGPGGPGEDGIIAPDGHCRPFDINASGTVPSDGAGVVALKRLDDAIADGDPVHAVILGSAVANDGAAKVGFAAPSVPGQVAAVRAAHQVAGIDPESVSFVEAHGTGTPVGDPIEVRALTQAFGPGARCLLGAVKANIGHTDTAAGVLGLIKVALALRAGVVPPTPNFTEPNPELDLANTPFEVTSTPTAWPRGPRPRRAGVHSLGLGGANAHVVLEEPPAAESDPGREFQLVPISARTPAAVTATAKRWVAQVSAEPLADVAWTAQTGRKAFEYRAFAVGASAAEVADALPRAEVAAARERGVVFLFPGQGGQHVGMGAELYRQEPVYSEVIDECAAASVADLGVDLRDVLLGRHPDADGLLATMEIGQPAVFATELALARLWESWCVTPAAVLGHSLGAYAAAAVAGALDWADALALVRERGRILGGLPAGAMLALPLAAADLSLGPDLSLAAVNGPDQCVVAGPVEAVDRLRAEYEAQGVTGNILHISTAAHSHLVQPELARFEKEVAATAPRAPKVPWVSDHSGRMVAEAADPGYWSAHLRGTVNFTDALETVFAMGDNVILEVGPGRTLAALTRRHPGRGDRVVVASMPHPADDVSERRVLLTAVGRIWQAGVTVDWSGLHRGERRLRVPMPTYPFQRVSLRVDRDDPGPVATESDAAVDESADPMECAVRDAFAAVLGMSGIHREANFFELGGDSMLAVRVAAALRRDLGVSLPARAVFRAPTVAALAAVIGADR
ncbi:type I polyketide synthase [Actinokineospora sp. HUAS TT18]|uniref:type I polyketide synthase n=1 Tax=Actinokineospora sp. HUAS TT18 TaxID=3447451 RepID=UPI003F521B4D